MPEGADPNRRTMASNRRVISVTCTCPGVARGFTNLVITKEEDGRIRLDPHATGACVLELDETAANEVWEAFGEWLG